MARYETSFRVNVAGLEHTLKDPNGPVARDLARRAQRVRDQAVVNASGRPGPNVDTGRLRASIGWRLVSTGAGWYAEVYTPVRYAGFVEFGTGPFVITPKGRPAGRNALYWKGALHPVSRVLRRGNRAYPFLRPALIAGKT
jgi:hypothetical protein